MNNFFQKLSKTLGGARVLKVLSRSTSTMSGGSKSRRGYQTGGFVQQADTQTPATSQDSRVSVAVVVPDEQSLDRMLAGGKQAMLDFIGENASSIRGMIQVNR